MRILIFGGWFGSRNAGDEAILLGLNRLLEKAFPDCMVYAHSIDPGYTKAVCGIEPISAPPERSLLRKAYSLASAYRSMDLVVVSGGTPIFDYRLLSRAFHFAVPILSGIPIAFVGVGLKPVRSRRGKWLFNQVLKRAVYVGARDPEVIDHLRQMGFDGDIELTADSAIVMESGPASEARALMTSAGVDLGKPIVAIAPIYLSADYKSHYHEPVPLARREYSYASLARVADHQIEQGRQVIFIPMHQLPPDDDREIIRSVRQQMIGRALVLEPPEDPRVVSALLRQADMLIGMRLHSLVLAASGGVPSVAIGFDTKVGGFMRYLGIGEYCHPIGDFTVEQLIESAEDCWKKRTDLSAQLERTMREWRDLVEAGIDRMTSVLAHQSP
jgi:polysaccharide pyruvyl transferase WcaK-like protein